MSGLRNLWRLLAVAIFTATLALPASAQTTKLLRFPDIHGDWIVFTYAGDLWKVPVSGGTALRLTAHPGLELFAKFSPDGQWIAFTGQYDGDEQVYIMPAAGGVPKQLTFYPAEGPLPARWGYDNQVYGWTPDGDRVLFRSLRDGFAIKDGRLFTVAKEGGLAEALPMPTAGAGTFSPDGKQMFYSPLFRDFRTWKRYQGGWAQSLYLFDLQSHATRLITNDPRTHRDPMWIGDKLYFASDRSDYLNLYEADPTSGAIRQLTNYVGSDVRWPSSDRQSRIVYELNGELRIYDVRNGEDKAVPIFVPDDGTNWRPEIVDASHNIEDFAISPKGERLVIAARGEVFTVPAEHGVTRNLTHTPNAHEREVAWSPDGKWIAYISDISGEEELYVIAQDAATPATQLTAGQGTAGMTGRLYHPVWSPTNDHLAFSDKDGRIFIIERATKKLAAVAKETTGAQARDYSWSPDGRYLAMSLGDPNGNHSLYIHDRKTSRTERVTGEMFNEFGPVWSPDGQYLYYLSDREFAPQLDTREWNYAVNRETGIFALALTKSTANLFPPKNDDPKPDEKPKKKDKDKEDVMAKKVTVTVDFDGLAERVMRVPLPADNYAALALTPTHLLYVRTGALYYGRDSEFKPELYAFAIAERETKKITGDVQNFALAAGGEKVAVQQGGGFKIYKLPDNDKTLTVSLSGLKASRVPRAEWTQIFNEVWRRYRDYFYVANMHGYDWAAIGDKYRALLPYVGHRADLNALMGEMIAELSVSHAYVSDGDLALPKRPATGVLGGELALDGPSGRYRIAHIYSGQNEEQRYRSPLTEVGVDIRAGDYILAINGRALGAADNPYELLRNTAKKPIELLVSAKPELAGARRVLVLTRASDSDLRYLEWVSANQDRVAKASNGRVGYLHIPDMGADGIREFIKWFYGQVRKEGLVVDVRGNGGGNVSSMLIERLRRELLFLTMPRTSDYPLTYPEVVQVGPKVAILNETSASDGDIFPYAFREAGIGLLVGKRSWGGVVGITDHGPLLDGGSVSVPEYGHTDPKGNWVIEGEGVHPDITVENDPAAVIRGDDPQLDRAIAEVMKSLPPTPEGLPAAAPAPVKTPRNYNP